jgi:hypothetical protein
MKAATVKDLRTELSTRSPKELMEYCLRMSKFKKENKELLTYLLFEASDEEAYIKSVKSEMDSQFEEVNKRNYYFIKKGVRKILRNVKKYIRYSQNKETEVELLLYFCTILKNFEPSIQKNRVLQNLYERQLGMIEKLIDKLHEDLQYDYQMELEELK